MKNQELFEHLVAICNHVLFSGSRDPSELTLPELSFEEWDNVFSMASTHGLLPTVMSLFEKRTIENQELRDAIIDWFGTAQIDASNYRMRFSAMRELSEMFAEDGIDVMFFKGAALAQLYPQEEWRVFSDIDFYLFGKWQEGNCVLERHGIECWPYVHHNTEAVLNGILLENHYDFLERMNHRQNLALDDELKRLAEKEGHSIKAEFLGEDVKNAYLMTPTMNAIFLMRHMATHFVSETIPLRMFYDWALFLKHHGNDVDWELVVGLYNKSGMMVFAGIIQGLLVEHLAISSETPVQPLTGEDTDRVWQSIMNPPKQNPYKKYSLKYNVFENKMFWSNRWKHKIVYPTESFLLLFMKYVWLNTKAMLGK